MNPVKRCPSCGLENAPAETLCARCMADISGVAPSAAAATAAPPEDDAGATRREERAALRFVAQDGAGDFVCAVGEIGRERAGRALLAAFPTVSRRHARLGREDGGWRIEDLGSTNGSWVNERRLEPGERRPLQDGDRLALSRSCVLVVREERG